MLSGDTGPTHIAAAVGTPIVAIFGPTRPTRNGPWSPDDVTVSRDGFNQEALVGTIAWDGKTIPKSPRDVFARISDGLRGWRMQKGEQP